MWLRLPGVRRGQNQGHQIYLFFKCRLEFCDSSTSITALVPVQNVYEDYTRKKRIRLQPDYSALDLNQGYL